MMSTDSKRTRRSIIDCFCSKVIRWLIDWFRRIKKSTVESFRWWRCFNLYVTHTIHEYDDSWSLNKRTFVSWRCCMLFHSRIRRLVIFQQENLSYRLSWRILDNFIVFKERTSLIWRFYFIYSRISTSNLLEDREFERCQLISQNSGREICCVRENESSSLLIKLKISCWRCAIVTNWDLRDFVSFYSLINW